MSSAGSGQAVETPRGMTGWLVAESVWWQGRLLGRSALCLADGRVADGPVPAAGVPHDAGVRALPGTLLPGLCDAHVHSDLVDLATVRAGGIAAVWDLGGVPDRVAALRERAVSGASLPLVEMAGPFLTAPGGYPADRSWAAPGSWRELSSPAQAADEVAQCRAAGATLIKVTAHTGGPMLDRSVLRAVVDHAHGGSASGERWLPVVVHAEGPGTVAAAVEAGADMLAHTPWTHRLDAGVLRSTVAAGMTWISTLDMHGWGRATAEHGVALENLRRFLERGGTVRYGTDLGNGPLVPGVNRREISALQRAGLTPDEVLTAMTGEGTGVPPCWIAGGLDLSAPGFADLMATARVVGPELRPRA
ncbi:amidohydrolase family protein [Mangrovihabitans endophyticus]|uniref:Amidohydrolase n=1 Tax=Mangrovihabitans endophyticus TaxID=1751298 RepID=A0A8J3FM31_9ACTN|nr:amidohydrolase [Mangrovihabitans endophyticus]GGK80917.1 amidohydrolase [Mangrovihabitans endophyticus]